MNATIDQMKLEAAERLEALEIDGLHENVLSEFSADGVLNYSERAYFMGELVGVLYWVSNDESLAKAIAEFEKRYNCVAYHATRENTEFGRLLSIFYVSSETEEWEMDREELAHGCTCAYVVNLTYPELSEFGSILFKVSGGGIVRTA